MMRIAVLQHVEFEGPAAVADWAAARGFPLRLFYLHRDPTLPSLADFDMLTVMGGPMSANDEARLGWLGPEIALICEAIAAGKTVLGICLGAQIIAKALGAGLSRERQRNRLVPCPANGLTSFLRRHTR